MSRWYFRHGGKKHATKSSTEIPGNVGFHEVKSTEATYSDTLILVTEEASFTSQTKEDKQENTLAPETTFEQREITSSSIDAEESLSKQHFDKYNSSTSTKRMHTNPGPMILMLILVFILGLALIGAMIFLISWIFVPVAIALRIALWGILIVFGVYLLLFLALLLIGD